ncbi:MAG: LytR family transcriptional regulator [Ruminococcaceae bacterium]|nr:LytR family transcriptional regulator [Oscillospiraceae bacterium]
MKKKKKGYSVGSLVATAALIVVIALAACIGFLWLNSAGGLNVDDPPKQTSQQPKTDDGAPEKTDGSISDKTQEKTDPKPVELVRREGVYNVLVVGRDAAASNTDVLMLVSFDASKGKVGIMQIPRDSYVVDSINKDKTKRVNAVYALASNKAYDDGLSGDKRQRYALDYLCDVVSDTFGIPVDRYVYVDLKAFREIVDIIGGVTVDVPADMDYDDPEQNLHIHIKKGRRKLDGKQAEGFVRFRSGYLEGDLGRLDAQKLFLSAMMDQLLSAETVGKIPQLMNSVYSHVVTDLSLSDLTYLASSVTSLDTGNIYMMTAPGEAYKSASGAWLYSLYKNECLELVNEYLNPYTTSVTSSMMSLSEQSHKDSGGQNVSNAGDIVNDQIDIPRV